MAIVQYSYANSALEQLRRGDVPKEERARAIKYILNDSYSSFKLLEEQLWDTEEQKQKAIHKVLRHPQQSYQMLTTPECFKLLNPNEVQVAILVAIEDPSYAYQVLASVDNISEKQRREALNVVTLHQGSTLNTLTNINVRKEDRLYVMQQVINNAYVIDSYIKTIYESCNKSEDFNDEVRALAFDKIFKEKDKGSLFWYAKKDYFYDNELEQVYNKYHGNYHDQYKLKFYDYLDFCTVFNKWLEKPYRERMAKKVMTKTQWHQVDDVCRNVTFPQDVMDKLEAYRMIEQFKNVGA